MSVEHPILTASARPPDRGEVTGPLPTDCYDVWEPATARADRPERGVTVALIHGGFWREAYDRTHLAPLAAALAADGFHVANLEYPRIGMPGADWPGMGTAVRGRVRSLRSDEGLPNRVIAVGHSAGGHLALWLASQRDPDAGLLGVVALGPAADLAEVHRLRLSNDAALALLGATPEEDPQRWADADPGRLHVRLPAVVLTGGRDEIVPGSVATAYRSTRGPQEPVTFTQVASADHFDLIDPEHESYLTLLAHLEQQALDGH